MQPISDVLQICDIYLISTVCTCFGKLLGNGLRLCLRDAFLDRPRYFFHQVLGFLEAQTW